MSDPFRITGPAVISFSGGRTSGYMLWRILQAHGGALPDDVVVCFANTGREMPATLDFVRDCGAHWSVPIVWLEFTGRCRNGYRVVNHNSASRDGEPFAMLLAEQSALPNPVARSCTANLKIRTIRKWADDRFGADVEVAQVIGLRADERGRVERALDPENQKKLGKEGRNILLPLAEAGVTRADVMAFWKLQPFDLGLSGAWEGNCDGCYLKSRAAIMRMLRDHPERMQWWERMEAVPRGTAGNGRYFRIDREPYAALADLVARTPLLPFDETMVDGGQPCGSECRAW